jgi:hypothetical protein
MRGIRPQNGLSSQSPALRARALAQVRNGLSLSGNGNASVAMIKLLPPHARSAVRKLSDIRR